MNFPKNASKQQKAYFSCMWHILGRKTVFVNLVFVQFYWFDKKKLFKIIQIFLLVFPYSNLLRKTNFLSICVILSEIVNFLTKKGNFQWISSKMLKNNRKA